MDWTKNHLNWSYGIALLIGLLCFVLAIVLNIWEIALVYIAVIFIGGMLVEWAKGQQKDIPVMLMILPPIYAIVVLCAKNKRRENQASTNIAPDA